MAAGGSRASEIGDDRPMTDPNREEVLVGGMDPRWAPVRVGDTVRRVPGSSGRAVRALLGHLEHVGFEAAPRFLGMDDQGREILSWVEGDVPLPPYPGWARSEQALRDLGGLVRRFHDATSSFRLPDEVEPDWATDWADPTGGATICHNDLFPENIVFRDGRVVALIDFAMAAPGRPLWDLAIAAELWAPLGDPAWRDPLAAERDAVRRFGTLARAYGLSPERAEELLGVVAEERIHSIENIRAEIAGGNPSWTANWAGMGGDERAAADDRWIEANRAALVDSLG
jgi:hypothetical protein